jgi:hypothetical protein
MRTFGDRGAVVLDSKKFMIRPLALYREALFGLPFTALLIVGSFGSVDAAARSVSVICLTIIAVVIVAAAVATLLRSPSLTIDQTGLVLTLPLKVRAIEWGQLRAVTSSADSKGHRLLVEPLDGKTLNIPGHWITDSERAFSDICGAFRARNTVAEQPHGALRDG